MTSSGRDARACANPDSQDPNRPTIRKKLPVIDDDAAVCTAIRVGQAPRGLTYHGHRPGTSRRSLPRPGRRVVGRGPVLHDRGNAAERQMGMARVVAP
jgi:hypothetical protein